jgi:signal transduction histidine kinase/ActR/RegA family two-component response regulator
MTHDSSQDDRNELMTDNEPARPGGASFWSLAWLLGLFFAGFLLIFGLHSTFSNLIDEVAKKSANEQARLFIGEEIIHCIRIIEKDFHRITTTTGIPAQERVGRQIRMMVDQLRHHLHVLQNGGTVNRPLLLNLEGQERVDREVTYRPVPDVSAYIMEIIELSPHLDQLETKLGELSRLLRLREEKRDLQDLQGLIEQERQISLYLKALPPFFLRINENANRLLFESLKRLGELEFQVAADRRRYKTTEVALVILVIMSVMLLSFFMARQINQSNRALRLAWQEMRLAKDEAERASQTKSHFVSRMSHELRTPMNAILGFAQLMEREQLPDSQRLYIKEINKAGHHLLELINQVLDLAKIEAGHLVLERQDYDLVTTVDEVASFIAESAHAKGLEVKAFASPDLPLRVVGDPPRLRQILINLLGNALKFTQNGEVGVWVEPSEDGSRVRFRVWDTGIGIDEDTLPRLFQPFAQADESTTRKFGGTGLGLMICKELVEAMGGAITIQSRPGAGTTFELDLPLVPSEAAVPRSKPLAKRHALVAGDDPLFVKMTQKHLESLGATVVLSRSKSETMAILCNGLDDLRVVIVDEGQSEILSEIESLKADHAILRLLVRQGSRNLLGEKDRAHADLVLRTPVTYTRLKEAIETHSMLPAGSSADTTGTAPGRPRDVHRVRVLVVEDNPVNQLVASGMLDVMGLEVEMADNGAEALAKLRAQRFDIVLMDVEMPVMDGYTATREIRRWEAESGRAHIPVIAMTANAMSEDQARCIASGMDDHLGKPFEMENLARLIRLWAPRFHHSA